LNTFTKHIAPVLLVASVIFGAVAMIWLEFDIDSNIKFGQRLAIGAIGAGRIVLFVFSAWMWGRNQAFAKWISAFSLMMAIVIYWYAENVHGLGDNQRLIYHALNTLLVFLEASLAMFMVEIEGNSSINARWEEQWAKLEKECDENERRSNASESKANVLEGKLNASEINLNAAESRIEQQLNAIKILQNKLNASESKLKVFECLEPILNVPQMNGNVRFILTSEGEFCFQKRGMKHIEDSKGNIIWRQ